MLSTIWHSYYVFQIKAIIDYKLLVGTLYPKSKDILFISYFFYLLLNSILKFSQMILREFTNLSPHLKNTNILGKS